MSTDYMRIIQELVTAAAKAVTDDMRNLANLGLEEPFNLYYQPSTDVVAGQLRLFRKSTPPDSSWTLATADTLGINIPYADYYTWIRTRLGNLPILPKHP